MEFRNVSWYNNETFKLLHRFNASLVLQDMPNSNNLSIDIPCSFAYFRFHGPVGDYRGSYTEHFLRQQAKKIRALLNDKKDVYVYFNNTMWRAFENAITLKEMFTGD